MSNIPLKENGSHTGNRHHTSDPPPRPRNTIDEDVHNNEDQPLRCVNQHRKQKCRNGTFCEKPEDTAHKSAYKRPRYSER